MARVRVAVVGEVPAGEGRVVEADGRALALFNVDGAYHCLDNVCPHRGGPLGEGDLEGQLVSCPWHAWRWDVTTGAHANNPAVRVPAFPVTVDDGAIFVGAPVSGAAPVTPVLDVYGRPLRNLRLSVTDRCNLRCSYCMPEEEYVWLPREDILTFEEAAHLVDVFADLGVDKVRLTGGEPLLRNGLEGLVTLLAANPRLRDLAITTNGILLAGRAAALRAAGLHRVTVSLDTLRPDRFKTLTRREALPQVLEGIASVGRAGFPPPKLDTVVMRGTNDDELVDLIEYARGVPAEIRFIEYMDVGGATRWTRDRVVSRVEMLELLGRRYGAIEPLNEGGSAPADRFRLPDGYVFGIIASTTAPFCQSCDRSRLTADGMWYLCLYANQGTDLRKALRAGASRAELRALILPGWAARKDRGAEDRLAMADGRSPLIQIGELKRDPHLEMHTRGG